MNSGVADDLIHRALVRLNINRPTRFVVAKIIDKRDAKTITGCLEALSKEFPETVYIIITDNDGAFTDRYAVDKKQTGRQTLRQSSV